MFLEIFISMWICSFCLVFNSLFLMLGDGKTKHGQRGSFRLPGPTVTLRLGPGDVPPLAVKARGVTLSRFLRMELQVSSWSDSHHENQ